jgi:hypothetical protein
MIVCSVGPSPEDEKDEAHDRFTAWMPATALVTFDAHGNAEEIDPGSWGLNVNAVPEYTCSCGAAAKEEP